MGRKDGREGGRERGERRAAVVGVTSAGAGIEGGFREKNNWQRATTTRVQQTTRSSFNMDVKSW